MAQVRKSRRRTPAGPRGLRQDSFKRLAAGENLHLYGSLPDPDPPSEIVPFDIVGEWSERAAGNPEERENVECLPFTTDDVEALLDLIVSARNSEIVRRYCSDEETLKSIGDRLRLSRERVRQIVRQGLREIRTTLQARQRITWARANQDKTDRDRARRARRDARDAANRFAQAVALRTAQKAAQKSVRTNLRWLTQELSVREARDEAARIKRHTQTRTEYRQLADELAIARADERTARSTGKGIEAAIKCTRKAETAYAEACAALRRTPEPQGAPAKSSSSALAESVEKVS